MNDGTPASIDALPDGAREIIDRLTLAPHPEGGWFRQTFRDERSDGLVRSTAIYYLLARGERSHWHRVRDASEVWHHYAGDPLRLSTSSDGVRVEQHVLGVGLAAYSDWCPSSKLTGTPSSSRPTSPVHSLR